MVRKASGLQVSHPQKRLEVQKDHVRIVWWLVSYRVFFNSKELSQVHNNSLALDKLNHWTLTSLPTSCFLRDR